MGTVLFSNQLPLDGGKWGRFYFLINYLYDGDNLIAEYDATGALQKKYIYSDEIDEPIREMGTVLFSSHCCAYLGIK